MGFQFQTKQSGHVSPYSAPFIRSKNPGQQHGKQVPGKWSMGAEGQLSRDLNNGQAPRVGFVVSYTSQSECKRSWPPRDTHGHLPKDTGKPAVHCQRWTVMALQERRPCRTDSRQPPQPHSHPTPRENHGPRTPGLAQCPALGPWERAWLLPWAACNEASVEAVCVTGAWPPPQQQGSIQAVTELSNEI